MRAAGPTELRPELERSAADYQRAAEHFEAIGGDLLGALAPHAAWTSAATHAVLPLLATDAGVRLQVETGIASHRRRFGAWGGGFWLPECAHAPWLDPLLEEAGVQATCVDLTDVWARADAAQLRPLRAEHGPLLVPIDRAIVELVWSDQGYPAHGTYRDYHHHTIHHHRPWANDGGTYDREAAAPGPRARRRLRGAWSRAGRAGTARPSRPVRVRAGHRAARALVVRGAWLDAVLDEAARQGLALARLDDALPRHEPAAAPAEGLPVTTWGSPRDLSTWDGPPVADLAWRARTAELRVAAAGAHAGERRALRELLALQSSDWAFMVTRDLAGPYPRERRRARHGARRARCAIGSACGPRERPQPRRPPLVRRRCSVRADLAS